MFRPMAAASTTVQDSSAEMDTSAQQGEIKQRLNELDKTISKLEDVGDPALADLVVAQKAETETLRGRLQEYKPTSQRLELAQDAAARKRRPVGEGAGGVATASGRESAGLAGGDVGTRAGSAGSGYVGCQSAARARASQRGYEADAMGCALVRHSFGAAGLAAALPPEVAKQLQSWLGSVSPDAMEHQLLENPDDGLECEVDVLDAESNSASSVLSPSASSRAAPAVLLPSGLPLKEPAGIPTRGRFFVAQ